MLVGKLKVFTRGGKEYVHLTPMHEEIVVTKEEYLYGMRQKSCRIEGEGSPWVCLHSPGTFRGLHWEAGWEWEIEATCAQQGCSPHPLLHWVWGRLQAVHRAEGKIIPHHQLLEAKEPQIWWGGQDQVWILRYWDQPIKIQRSGISFSFLPSPASRPLKGEENSALGFCLIPVSLFVTRTNCLVVIT